MDKIEEVTNLLIAFKKMELREGWDYFWIEHLPDVTEFLYKIRYQLMINRRIPTHPNEVKAYKFWEILNKTTIKGLMPFEASNLRLIEEFLDRLIRSKRLSGGKFSL